MPAAAPAAAVSESLALDEDETATTPQDPIAALKLRIAEFKAEDALLRDEMRAVWLADPSLAMYPALWSAGSCRRSDLAASIKSNRAIITLLEDFERPPAA